MLTIYHNPRCSKSRKALELLEDSGMSFEIHQYLKRPPKESELRDLVKLLALKSPLEMMRSGESILDELQIDLEKQTDAELIALMHRHPILIERPIVFTDKDARIGRPPEDILDLID